MVGDFDLEELENIDGTYQEDSSVPGLFNWNDPLQTVLRYPVWILVVSMGFLMTIAMMNIFIAVLGENFERNFARREQLFLHARASMLKDYFAMWAVLQKIGNTF